MATVLEGARLLKKSTGIVATSRVTHATPAAYIAHAPSRGDEDDIMEQAVHQGIDVVFGGGKRHLVPKEFKGRRTDGDNLYERLKHWGYRIVETREQMQAVAAGRVYGMFAASHMDPEIDRPRQNPHQPTLAEMTRKAIELLARNRNGFFLMVEGSQIDWACHAHDPAYLLSDLLAFDQAVQAALDFARRDANTLVLVMSDHNTGGFSIGNFATDSLYPQLKVEQFLAPFRKMQASAFAMMEQIGTDKTPARVQAVIKEGWALEITDEEARQILAIAASRKDAACSAIGEVLCPKYTYVGWSTHGHTGGDVPLYAFGPGKPGGVVEAIEIARVCAAAMGLDLARLNERLFVDAAKAFADGRVGVDRSDPVNPVVKIDYRGRAAELPVNQNFLKLGERMFPLEGVVVYAPATGRAYIPLQAVRLIRGEKAALPRVTNW
jgi:alkaline phosphatase